MDLDEPDKFGQQMERKEAAIPARRAFGESQRNLMRLLVAGNAGGAIAALSVFGTYLGASRGAPVPVEIFWTLAIFLVGLLGVWFYRVTDIMVYGYVALGIENGDSIKANKKAEFARLIQYFGASIASLCLLVGTALGLCQLWRLTDHV